MHVTIIVGRVTRRVRRVDFPGRVRSGRCRRPTGRRRCARSSFPVQSLMETGRSGGENFSPNCGENGSNSDVKSSVMMPGEVSGDVGRGEDAELGQRGSLVCQRHFLAIAQIARRSGERRNFARPREQADEVRNERELDPRKARSSPRCPCRPRGVAGRPPRSWSSSGGCWGCRRRQFRPGRAG